ncbi:MAG: DNA polymerase IV, partial [Lachnospiraceae bacterium]|nr:DNA polymerase IV [Lachnospiraceae bacterium]
MRNKIIFHIDVNSAFLSWEAVYRLRFLNARIDLRDIPSAIGGDMAMRHGIILAKSIPAKKYGIKTGETLMEARQKCPNLLIAPPNYGLYEQCSKAFMDILKEYSPTVEQYSIDEAYVDMSGMESLLGNPEQAAEDLKNRIARELGFTVNIGISENKLLAKMASDFQKPHRVHTLYPEEIPEKMWKLPVSDLFFVGRATTRKLIQLGIQTIGQLAQADPTLLRFHLKK